MSNIFFTHIFLRMITIHKFAVYCFATQIFSANHVYGSLCHFLLLFCFENYLLLLLSLIISLDLSYVFYSQVGYKLLFKLVNLFVYFRPKTIHLQEYSSILNINLCISIAVFLLCCQLESYKTWNLFVYI